MISRYRVVVSVSGSGRLLASALAGRLPQGMAGLAVLLLVRGATHSYAAAGLATGAYAFASAGCAPLQGRLVDRYGRVRVLVPSVLVQTAALAALVVCAVAGAPPAPLVVLSGVAGGMSPPVAPAARALLGAVFTDTEARETAYSLDSVLQELVWVTGPLLVGIAVALSSAAGAVLALAAIGLAGTGVFVSSPLVRAESRPAVERDPDGALASRELRRLLGPIGLAGLALGAVEVGLPSLALHAGSRPASGLLLALWSIGSLVGGVAYGARTWAAPVDARYRILLWAAVLFTGPLVAAHSIPAGAACSFLAGLVVAPMFTCQYTLVGRAVRPGRETESFTWVTAALVGGLAAGNALGGIAIALGGVSAPFQLSCLAWAVSAAVAVRLRERVAQLA